MFIPENKVRDKSAASNGLSAFTPLNTNISWCWVILLFKYSVFHPHIQQWLRNSSYHTWCSGLKKKKACFNNQGESWLLDIECFKCSVSQIHWNIQYVSYSCGQVAVIKFETWNDSFFKQICSNEATLRLSLLVQRLSYSYSYSR